MGVLDTDDEKAAGRTSYVDPYHYCPPCGELANAEALEAATAEDTARDDEVLARVARALKLTPEALREALAKDVTP